jgi:NAD(P)-dependent dehydrogenase (short-subunit alcohol dehydrogenase family)
LTASLSQPLTDKVALITASSRYTGSVIASTLACAGAKTAIHYHRSQASAEALVQELSARGLEASAFRADGRKPDELRRLADEVTASAFIRSDSIHGLAKAALIHLTEALAVELAPSVTVNAIAPGQIEDSELIDEFDPNHKQILREESPLKRLVTRQDVADLVWSSLAAIPLPVSRARPYAWTLAGRFRLGSTVLAL